MDLEELGLGLKVLKEWKQIIKAEENRAKETAP